MTLRDRVQALNHWLAERIHGPYIRGLEYMRDLLNRDDSAYAAACDIRGCHRVARGDYETDKRSLRLCYPCANAFQHGLADDSVAFTSKAIDPERTRVARLPGPTRQ